jgi:ComF family protein
VIRAMLALRSTAYRIAGWLGETVFPQACQSCGRMPPADNWLCGDCRASLAALAEKAACEKCGAPAALDGGPCPFCRGLGHYPLDGVGRLGVYDEPLRGLLLQMKRGHRWPLAEHVARLLCQRPLVERLAREVEVIVPIPLHWLRRLGRGYNQSDAVARIVGKTFGRPVARPIIRVRNTPPQTQMTAQAQRRANIKNAFALIDEHKVTGKRVLLVDDILTTGATVCEAARCMLWAKPASLSAVVVAVADPRGRNFTRV